MTSDLTEVRQRFVDYVRRQLVGPFGGDREVIVDMPHRRYMMGIIFPRSVDFAGYVESEGESLDSRLATTESAEEDLFSDDPVSVANDFLPASQGLSFFTSSRRLKATVRAARYETLSGADSTAAIESSAQPVLGAAEPLDGDPRPGRRMPRRVWQRVPLPVTKLELVPGVEKSQVLDGRGEVHVRWRPYEKGALVTVTVVNAATAADPQTPNWDDLLLQVELEVDVLDDGEILEYPSADLFSCDPEDEELRLLYRDSKTFAIGHGCAPEWTTDDANRVVAVRAEAMPSHIVPDIRPAGHANPALSLTWLASDETARADVVTALNSFVDDYEAWVAGERTRGQASPVRYRKAATRLLQRLDRAVRRMREGVETLADPSDDTAFRAFRFANRAMARQMRHGAKDLAGVRRRKDEPVSFPDHYAGDAKWHPFQLGFALQSLRGMVDPMHEDRDVVDLIWFPTGGGKTEAYLLLSAFEIFHRRLVHGVRGGGVTVISRYTLSLLTTQQFQRAATTVCACEIVRRDHPKLLGEEPIGIGLWVGESTTPNRYSSARELADEWRELEEPDERFLLERCPWCGTEMAPRHRTDDDGDYGVRATDTSFRFHCPRTACAFYHALPVHVVDDDLYDNPPTFLLGTVDKFAGLAWESRSGTFFGAGDRLPPTLIIQDELHLLTGQLGTTVGVYEAAILLLCEERGRGPKIIASTATIRRAPEQVNGLYGRSVNLFPPTGLTAGSSYFAEVDPGRPGRMYVGIMAQGHSSETATVHAAGALIQAPKDLGLTGPARDAYWTLVAYHTSLRELGRTVTLARDDIPARLRALLPTGARKFEVEELTSNIPRAIQPQLLERLEIGCDDPSDRSVDFLATTNMLSVGVDIDRLGLMFMDGQPKATAEYIQATSRVGRKYYPGLVFGLFRATRPRDRSHYETFRSYHSALYRFVEPTSVTPYSAPSRERALHAALVILVRHRVGLASDDQAGQVLGHIEEVRSYIERLVAIVERVEPREARGARDYLLAFLDDWCERARRAHALHRSMYYRTHGRNQINLLKDFNIRSDAWPTPRSMRNVDRQTAIEVMRGGQ